MWRLDILSTILQSGAIFPADPRPVGGVVAQVDKFAIIAPYLVLIGLVAIASIIYIKKRRKN